VDEPFPPLAPILRAINAAWVRLIENGAVEVGNRDAIIRPTVLA
jgi:hypothetical protein